MEPLIVAALAAAGFAAGFVDAIAGGGGLLSLPALLAAGVPPHAALATNKVQSALGTTISAARYLRHGYVHLPLAITAFAASFAGSYMGAWTVLRLPSDFLAKVIPALIIIVGVITFIRKNFGVTDRFTEARIRHFLGVILFASTLGFYDGFFGPGTGSFLAFGFVFFFRFGFVRATGNAKAANLASNYAAITAFLFGGKILWPTAVIMGIANILGAWIGAGLTIRGGTKIIKPVFAFVLTGLLIKIIFFS
ncbi:MAG: TSUP family transporter [Bacteroidota bacterium]|nr:TSUP family transporter [Bacteroidota bacterium]